MKINSSIFPEQVLTLNVLFSDDNERDRIEIAEYAQTRHPKYQRHCLWPYRSLSNSVIASAFFFRDLSYNEIQTLHEDSLKGVKVNGQM